jgi:hypothetical protein
MTVKTEVSPSSDAELGVDELEDFDSQHVTLAQALEQANLARDTVVEIKGEMLAELERFRAAMRHELKARKNKFDLHDAFLFAGLTASATGIAVAFHWAYSLIFVGGIFVALSLITLFRTPVKT